jgi:uncharacterized protein (TIRG00374 family)
VPAGGAIAVGLTYTMLSSWGFSKSRTTLFVVVTGIWNNFIKLGMPILALAILALTGQTSGGRIAAAVLGLGALAAAVALFALVLRSEDFAAKVGITAARWVSAVLRLFRRGPVQGWDLAVVKWRGRVIGLVRHRWLALTVTSLMSHLSLYAVLLVTLRVMDVPASEVGWAEILAIFAFARLVTAIPLTPGGVGFVEIALIAGLTGAGGERANVVAAVLLYRVLTYVFPIVIGAGTYIFWRRNRSWRDSAPPLRADGTLDRAAAKATATADPNRPPAVYRRRWLDAGWLGGGLAVLALTAYLARQGLFGWEKGVFAAVNGLPDWLRWPLWPFMQYGVFLTIPVLVGIALLVRRFRLAAAMAVAGVGVYLVAKVIKEVVHRGRPDALIDNVTGRETFAAGSLGYPSGHAAVAAAMTVVLTPYLRGWWKAVPAALLVIVGVGRMYVAAHVPLDLIGGAALGAAAGGLAMLIVGVPVRRPATGLDGADVIVAADDAPAGTGVVIDTVAATDRGRIVPKPRQA